MEVLGGVIGLGLACVGMFTKTEKPWAWIFGGLFVALLISSLG